MIPNREGSHYFAAKILSVLLGGRKSKDHGDHYFLNCLHAFRTNLNHIKKYVKIKIFVI